MEESVEAANIRVLVRIRPLNTRELRKKRGGGRETNSVLTIHHNPASSTNQNGSKTTKDAVPNTIQVNVSTGDDSTHDSGFGSMGDVNNNALATTERRQKQFNFDAVLGPRSSQAEVFDCTKSIVEACARGYNGTIMAYGQTGSGKTHTMFGSGGNSAGLIQRSLRDLFCKINLGMSCATHGITENNTLLDEIEDISTAGEHSKTTIHASFFEIFNERVYDLLAVDESKLENSLPVREDTTKGGVYVDGLREVLVHNTSDAENVIDQGMRNRHVASTAMNRTSSRSHAVFVLSMKVETVSPDGLSKTRRSKFTLVDLAGSERQKTTEASGARLKEASMINKSLLSLGQVINALVGREAGSGKGRHIHYRDSKLTFLLRDSLGGNSKTCLVATVSPDASTLGETLSTLNFAQRAKQICNTAVVNEDVSGTVAALKAEVSRLRSELHDSASRRNTNGVCALTQPAHLALEGSTHSHSQLVYDGSGHSGVESRCAGDTRIQSLEQCLGDERKIVLSLKRKLDEERLVRKFKEARIDYLQSKKKRAHPDENEEVAMLCRENDSLRRQLEFPSADALQWRAAYEQQKELLNQYVMDGTDEALGTSFASLNSELEKLRAENFSLEKRLSLWSAESKQKEASRQEYIRKCENECKDKQRELVEERQLSEAALDAIADLEKQVKSLQEELQESRKTVEKADSDALSKSSVQSEEVLRLKSELNDLTAKIESMEKEHVEIEEQSRMDRESLNAKLEEMVVRATEWREIEANLNQKLDDACKDNSILVKQVQEYSQNYVKLEEMDVLKSKLQETEQVIEELQESRETAEKSVSEAVAKNEVLSKEIMQLKNEIDTKVATINTLEEKLVENEGEFQLNQELRERVDRMTALSTEWKDTENVLRKKLEGACQENANFIEKIDDFTQNYVRKEEMDKLKSELKVNVQFKKELEESQKNAASTAKAEKDVLSQEVLHLKSELNQKHAMIDKIQKQDVEKEGELRMAQERFEEEVKRVATLSTEWKETEASLREKLAVSCQQNAALMKQIDDFNENYVKKEEMDLLKGELQQINASKDELEESRKSAQKTESDARSEKDALSQEVLQLKNELNEKMVSIDTIEKLHAEKEADFLLDQERLKKKIEDMTELSSEWKETEATLRKKLDASRQDNEELMEQVKNFTDNYVEKEEMDLLKGELQKLNASKDELEQTRIASQKTESDVRDENDALSKEVLHLKNELNEKIGIIDTVEKQHAEKEADFLMEQEQLKEKIEDMSALCTEWKETEATLRQKLAASCQEKAALIKQVEDFTQNYVKKENIDLLKSELEHLHTSKEKLEESWKTTQESESDVRAEKDVLANEVLQLRNELNEKMAMLNNIEKLHVEKEADFLMDQELLKEKVEHMTALSTEWKQTETILREKLNNASKDNDILIEQVKDFNQNYVRKDEMDALRCELSNAKVLQEELEVSRKQLANSESDVETEKAALSEEMEQLKTDLIEKTAIIAQMEKQQVEMESEQKRLNEEFEQATELTNEWKKTEAILRQKLEESCQDNATLVKQVKSFQQNYVKQQEMDALESALLKAKAEREEALEEAPEVEKTAINVASQPKMDPSSEIELLNDDQDTEISKTSENELTEDSPEGKCKTLRANSALEAKQETNVTASSGTFGIPDALCTNKLGNKECEHVSASIDSHDQESELDDSFDESMFLPNVDGGKQTEEQENVDSTSDLVGIQNQREADANFPSHPKNHTPSRDVLRPRSRNSTPLQSVFNSQTPAQSARKVPVSRSEKKRIPLSCQKDNINLPRSTPSTKRKGKATQRTPLDNKEALTFSVDKENCPAGC